jgi:hypothetical protein
VLGFQARGALDRGSVHPDRKRHECGNADGHEQKRARQLRLQAVDVPSDPQSHAESAPADHFGILIANFTIEINSKPLMGGPLEGKLRSSTYGRCIPWSKA